MKFQNRNAFVVSVAALVLAGGCDRSTKLGILATTGDGGLDASSVDAADGTSLDSASVDAGDGARSDSEPADAAGDGCPGARGMNTQGEVPTEHRSTAKACNPSLSPPLPDGGLATCTTDADCAEDGGSLFRHCLRGRCSLDQCLSDSDCTNAVCGCSSDYYGGTGLYHANVCVPAQCHVDADCGSGGYCSPSHGSCGSYEGFYCHRASDTCVNPATDCGSCGTSCVYAPMVGSFVCGMALCSG